MSTKSRQILRAYLLLSLTFLTIPTLSLANNFSYKFPANKGWDIGNSTTEINYEFLLGTPEEICSAYFTRLISKGAYPGYIYKGYEAKDPKNGYCLVQNPYTGQVSRFAYPAYRSHCPYDSHPIVSEQYNSQSTYQYSSQDKMPDYPNLSLWITMYDDPELMCIAYQSTYHIKSSINKELSSSCLVTGNPILIATGNKYQTETDYQPATAFGLSFSRYFNSTAYDLKTDIGIKWSHRFQQKVSATGTNTLAYRATGQAFTFNYDGSAWVGDVDIPDTLIELVDASGNRTGWEYHDSSDNVEVYNASGQLLSITNRAGQTQSLFYDVSSSEGGDGNNTTLDKVVGAYGEVMLFSYDTSQRISTMTDPDGGVYSYHYDGLGNLVSVTYPDDTPSDNSDNPVRTYHYENTDFPHHLTGITDENGVRFATWAYDTQGRAISSEHAGGVEKATLDFSVDNQVTVTNALGKDTTYHFTTLHGVKKVTSVEGHATQTCAAANKAYTYDANGYLASKTDWQGNVTSYVHDDRGLEVSRTEAVGTSQERTITTTWHADFRLPLTITEPGKVTSFSYDDKGRLLSKQVSSP